MGKHCVDCGKLNDDTSKSSCAECYNKLVAKRKIAEKKALERELKQKDVEISSLGVLDEVQGSSASDNLSGISGGFDTNYTFKVKGWVLICIFLAGAVLGAVIF